MTLATVGVSLVISTMPMLTPTVEHAVLPDEAIIANRLAQALRDAQRLIQRAALQQDAELIPAQARQRVAAAHPRLQHPGDLLQQLIAGRMSAGIVDQLELIQIQIQQRMADACASWRTLSTAAVSRFSNSRRLMSPVSASWLAW